MTDEKNLNGLRGWLLVAGFVVVITPLFNTYHIYQYYTEFIAQGSWETLTTVGSAAYHPLWKPIIIFEAFFNLGMFLAWAFAAVFFFLQHKAFPKLYIGILLFSLFAPIFDKLLIQLASPNTILFDENTKKILIKCVVHVVIWIPYLILSKRVKATFVKSFSDINIRSEKSMTRPISMDQAVLAIWATLALACIGLLFNKLTNAITLGEFAAQIIVYGLFCIFPYKIGMGSNATRYIFTVIAVISYLLMIAGIAEKMPIADIVVSIISFPLDLFIIYRLFQKESSAWFTREKTAN